MNELEKSIIKRVNRVNILLRRINVNIKNIDETLIGLKLYNTRNQKYLEKIMNIEEKFIDATEEIKKLEENIWIFI